MTLTSWTNPILARIRRDNETHNHRMIADRIAMWIAAIDALQTFGGFTEWDVPNHFFHVLTSVTHTEAEDARRVLHKLAALAEGART